MLVLALLGCPHPTTDTTPVVETDVDTDSDADADSDVDADSDADTDVTGETGAPIPADTVTVADGEDWRVPAGVVPVANSGFFSETARPAKGVDTGVIDVTWAQLEPRDGEWSTTTTGSAQGMRFASLDDQLAAMAGQPRWIRIWFSSTDWAPSWVQSKCGVTPISGTDYDGQRHLPIWDDCVWNEIVAVYDEFLVRRGMLADPLTRLVYVPGAFTWCEFDYDMVNRASSRDGLTWPTFDAWFGTMVTDLARIGGADVDKLVFTGEDYPYGSFGTRDDLQARQVVTGGLGIRNGITEVSNNHLSEVPAYGVHIAPDGHLVTDESWPLLGPDGVIGAENECFDDCGHHADDLAYAIRQANLKALQLRVNWLYVVPGPSHLDDFPEHWAWVRAELGQRPSTAFDAWAQLRDAEDRYWTDEGTGPDGTRWDGFPFVKNLERWLVQRDVPGAISARGTDRHARELDPYNGVAWA
ncbi:MAG: hypothetical protein KC621_10630, partial [Myxococcales bacterium]|nr:hypothetical protein [Myxococcales bacterium]